MIKEFIISSKDRYQLIDITDKVEKIVEESKVRDGLVLIFTPHSTAAIVLTEDGGKWRQFYFNYF